MRGESASPQSNARRGTRGASLVEFAFVLPLLTVLLFGLLTGGLTLSRQNAVKNAVRETTRFGAVFPSFPEAADTNPGELNELYNQLVMAGTGDLDTGADGREICVALIDDSDGDGTDNWWWEVYTDGSAADASGDNDEFGIDPIDSRCTEGFNSSVGAGTRRIWVRAERQSEIDAIFYSYPITIDAHSLSRYER